MKEIEILVRVMDEETDHVLKKLHQEATYKETSSVKDTYYYDPLRLNLTPNDRLEITECFRVREKEDQYFLTYKVDHFDETGKWLYSDEDETKIGDANVMKRMIQKLGLKELVIVDMKKYFFEHEEYKIALEVVQQLGNFLEVESKNRECSVVELERQKISDFIQSLNLNVSKEVEAGKPELLLKKMGY